MSLDHELKQKLIDDYKVHEGDTGSPEVQVALLTTRIGQLTEGGSNHRLALLARVSHREAPSPSRFPGAAHVSRQRFDSSQPP